LAQGLSNLNQLFLVNFIKIYIFIDKNPNIDIGDIGPGKYNPKIDLVTKN